MALQWGVTRRMAEAGAGLRKVALGDLFAIDPEVTPIQRCARTPDQPGTLPIDGVQPVVAMDELRRFTGAPIAPALRWDAERCDVDTRIGARRGWSFRVGSGTLCARS
jgi:hypothetical protein